MVVVCRPHHHLAANFSLPQEARLDATRQFAECHHREGSPCHHPAQKPPLTLLACAKARHDVVNVYRN